MSPPKPLQEDGADPPVPPPASYCLRGESGAIEPQDVALRPTLLMPDVPPGPEAPAGVVVRAAIASALSRLQEHEPEARAGSDEAVHQMRVATRRLRSDLRTFRTLIEDAWARPLRTELKWMAGVLGALRELDVLSARLQAEAANAKPSHREALQPLWDELEARRVSARHTLSTALDSARYRALCDALVEGARAPVLTLSALGACRDVLPGLVRSAWKSLAAAGRRVRRDDPDETLHEVRIRAKRARYAAEAVAPALDEATASQALKFARAAAGVQAVLGEHQDAVVARAEVEQATSRHPEAPNRKRAVAEIVRAQNRAARKARRAFRKAWNALDRKKRRTWMG